MKQAIIYKVKCIKQALMSEVNAAKDIRLRFLDVLLKLLLPLSFIALKLMGSFIDFMLALGFVN